MKFVWFAVATNASSLTRGPTTLIVPPLELVVSVTERLLSKLNVTPVPPMVLVVTTEVVPVPAATPNKPSLSVSPSTSDDVMVILDEVPARVMLDPAVMVTSVPLEELSVNGEEVPLTERSVPGPEAAAMVMVLPVSDNVTFAPADKVTAGEPVVFELIMDVEAVPAPTDNEPSFELDKSPVLLITVPVTSIPVPAV